MVRAQGWPDMAWFRGRRPPPADPPGRLGSRLASTWTPRCARRGARRGGLAHLEVTRTGGDCITAASRGGARPVTRPRAPASPSPRPGRSARPLVAAALGQRRGALPGLSGSPAPVPLTRPPVPEQGARANRVPAVREESEAFRLVTESLDLRLLSRHC